MTTKRDEHAKLEDAIRNGRDRREEIKAEWEKLGLEPRIQSPDELRRVLMTWRKEDLVTFTIRAESDAIKQRHRTLNAWADANEIREHALVLPRNTKQHEIGGGEPFTAWLSSQTQKFQDARDIFMAGWRAHARAREAVEADAHAALDSVRALHAKHENTLHTEPPFVCSHRHCVDDAGDQCAWPCPTIRATETKEVASDGR